MRKHNNIFSRSDKESKPGYTDCKKPGLHCPPGFEPKYGVCNKDIFITVHGKGGGNSKSESTSQLDLSFA